MVLNSLLTSGDYNCGKCQVKGRGMATPADKKQGQGFDLLSLLGFSGDGNSGGGMLAGMLKQFGIFDMLASIPIIGPMLVASLEQQAAPDAQIAAASQAHTEKATTQLKIIYNALGNQTSLDAQTARKNIEIALDNLTKGNLKLTDSFVNSAAAVPAPAINTQTGLAKTVNAAFAGGVNEHTLALVVPLAAPAMQIAAQDPPAAPSSAPQHLAQTPAPGPKG